MNASFKLSPLILFFLTILIGGCAATGSTNEVMTYNHDYDTMVETVAKAIRSSRLNVEQIQENEEGTEFEYIFSERVRFNNEKVQGNLGRAIIKKINEQKTSVKIINPDYHFTVPADQRRDYRSSLGKKIDDFLAES